MLFQHLAQQIRQVSQQRAGLATDFLTGHGIDMDLAPAATLVQQTDLVDMAPLVVAVQLHIQHVASMLALYRLQDLGQRPKTPGRDGIAHFVMLGRQRAGCGQGQQRSHRSSKQGGEEPGLHAEHRSQSCLNES